MSSHIKRLSKQLAGQIAAGEVVERPSSVVKELLENAVDAGGTSILCEIKNAGKTLIRVRDNGEGIPKEELPLALAPHATSKIHSVEDLTSITTLGFRGEALASIASVSRLVLTSKTRDEENAYCVRVEGEEQNPLIEPAAHPDGTTVDVSDLFFNTPARRRFLKSDRTEFSRIRDIFVRVALAHQHLAFELVNDGKTVLKVNRSSAERGIDLKRTCTLIGQEFSRSGFEVICEDPNLRIEGMIMPPPRVEEALVEKVYLFFNGRPVSDKVITHALKEGFFEVLGKTLPIRCVLYLFMDPREVDVNVHPRKDEVRFHNSALVHDLITDTIVHTLRKNGIGPYRENDALDEVPLPNDDISIQSSRNDTSDGWKMNSSHISSYDINDQNLPAFPKNTGAFIDLNKVEDRGVPQIIRRDSGMDVREQRSGFQDGIRMPRNQEETRRNISVYQQHIEASNKLLNVRTNLERDDGEHRTYSDNGIVFLDSINADTSLIRADGRYYLVRLSVLDAYFKGIDYGRSLEQNRIERLNLSIPYILKVKNSELTGKITALSDIFYRCGFSLKVSASKIEIISIPAVLKGTDLASYALCLFEAIVSGAEEIRKGECPKSVRSIVGHHDIRGANSINPQLLLRRLDAIDCLQQEEEGALLEVNLRQMAYEFGEGHEK